MSKIDLIMAVSLALSILGALTSLAAVAVLIIHGGHFL